MSALAELWQTRRAQARSRRELTEAIRGANAETVRVELLAIAGRHGARLTR